MEGETVPMVCIKCFYRGGGKLPRRSIFGKIKAIRCPKCGNKSFVQDHNILY